MARERTESFGYWLRRRRKALDLTQAALAERACCSSFSIRKIEADLRRPSRRLAERLAASLAIPDEERKAFLEAARAVGTVRLPPASRSPIPTAATAAPLARTAPAGDAAPFVGRTREYELLIGFSDRLEAGLGRPVLVEGEPGIGKSRLLREVVRHARARGLPTFATKCYEIERAIPYQPVIELIAQALGRVSDADLRALGPVSLAEIANLAPELGARLPGLPVLSNDYPEARQARLSRAVGHLLDVARAGQPTLVLVDDLQWADEASMQVLHYLARQAEANRALVIYAYRDEDLHGDEKLGRLIASLCREAGAERLALARLEPADTARVVEALAPAAGSSGALAARLHRETDGNPFFLISILESLRAGELGLDEAAGAPPVLLPEALREAVRMRLAQLPRALRATLEVAAVIGRRFEFPLLEQVAGEPEQGLSEALEALVQRRLLHEEHSGGSYDFTHDKLREVVYRDIGGARRRLLHRAVAEALERRGENVTHEQAARLAEHYERAQVWPSALRYLLLAGDRAGQLFAMRDALHWLDRAVALGEAHASLFDDDERLALYERRGTARILAGRARDAVADLRRVVETFAARGDGEQRRRALVQLGMACRRADAYEEAVACLEEALRQARAMGLLRETADTLYHLGTVSWSNGRNDRAIEFHRQAVEICERAGFTDLVAVQAWHGRGETHYANTEPAAAIDCFSRSLELARRIEDRSYECENLMMIGHTCVGSKGLGDYPRATQQLEAALAIAREADLQWHMGPILLGLDHVRACTGRYGEAWTGMRKCLQWLSDLGQVRYQLIAYDFMGLLLLELGANELAVEHMQRGLELARDTGIMFWQGALDTHLAVARSRLGDGDAAPALAATLERARASAERHTMIGCIDGLAEMAWRAGDAARCRELADALLAVAAPHGLREYEARARRWRGEALLLARSPKAAESELNAAGELARAIGRPRLELDVARALAALERRRGHGEQGVGHAARAQALRVGIERSLAGCELAAQLD